MPELLCWGRRTDYKARRTGPCTVDALCKAEHTVGDIFRGRPEAGRNVLLGRGAPAWLRFIQGSQARVDGRRHYRTEGMMAMCWEPEITGGRWLGPCPAASCRWWAGPGTLGQSERGTGRGKLCMRKNQGLASSRLSAHSTTWHSAVPPICVRPFLPQSVRRFLLRTPMGHLAPPPPTPHPPIRS